MIEKDRNRQRGKEYKESQTEGKMNKIMGERLRQKQAMERDTDRDRNTQ